MVSLRVLVPLILVIGALAASLGCTSCSWGVPNTTPATVTPTQVTRGVRTPVTIESDDPLFKRPFEELKEQYLTLQIQAEGVPPPGRGAIHNWLPSEVPTDSAPFHDVRILDERTIQFELDLPPDWPTGTSFIQVGTNLTGSASTGNGIHARNYISIE